VVFNFPTGDTVPLNIIYQNPDYYTLTYNLGRQSVSQQTTDTTLLKALDVAYYQSIGRKIIDNNPQEFGKVIWRPVDKRENYVKRCVGIPGDKLQIINNQIYVNGKPQEKFSGIQFNYFVQTDGTPIDEKLTERLGISHADFNYIQSVSPEFAMQRGLNPNMPVYHFPLTAEMYDKLAALPFVTKLVVTQPLDFRKFDDVYPLGNHYGWNRDNYGPINIPAKGQTFELTLENLPIYERAISVYENNKLEVKEGKIYINDTETRYYTFKMDYYWMMGDNRHNSADSRYWGFVPEDHIVGRPVFVWLSLNKDKGLFSGKIRWNRIFRNAER
jgi:signal peptidase I